MTPQEFFKRYEYHVVDDRLGGGAFGTVFKAYDNVRNRHVAIKVAEVKNIGDKKFSLDDELSALRGIPEHTNVAYYEDVFQFTMQNGIYDYAIMQYYPLGNLRDLLRKQNLADEHKKEILQGILDGVEHLHQYKVIHRDLKPSNILISQKGEKFIPKIADFGLSKRMAGGDQSVFSNSFAGGTLAYSSPEQLLGKPIKTNTDLWAFGVMIYEIMLGERPFVAGLSNQSTSAGEREVYDKIVNAQIPAILGQVAEPFQTLIKKCLIAEPELRVKDCAEVRMILGENNTTNNTDPTVVGDSIGKSTLFEAFDIPETEAPAKPPKNIAIAAQKSKDRSSSKMLLPIVGGGVLLILLLGGIWFWKSSSNDVNDIIPLKQSLIPYQQGNKWGYIDDVTNKVVIPARYDKVGTFGQDSALIKNEDSLYYINRSGEIIRIISPKPELTQDKNERLVYEEAKKKNTIEAFEAYVDQYPDGRFITAARIKIDGLIRKQKARKPDKPNTVKTNTDKPIKNTGGTKPPVNPPKKNKEKLIYGSWKGKFPGTEMQSNWNFDPDKSFDINGEMKNIEESGVDMLLIVKGTWYTADNQLIIKMRKLDLIARSADGQMINLEDIPDLEKDAPQEAMTLKALNAMEGVSAIHKIIKLESKQLHLQEENDPIIYLRK